MERARAKPWKNRVPDGQKRLPLRLPTFYQNLDPAKISSVFEAIEADELVS